MKILLVGEYSNFHNSLKKGLQQLGHEVILCSDVDFKGYPNDITVYARFFKDIYILNLFRQILFRVLKVDLAQIEIACRFYFQRKKMTGYDVVQLVNEQPLQSTPFFEKKIISFLRKHNKKMFLVSCGDDYPSVNFMKSGGFRYSVLTPCIEDPTRTHCQYTMRFLKPQFKVLHEYVYSVIDGVIAGDLDYAIPLLKHPQYKGLIPYPIDVEQLHTLPIPIKDKIVIFHGINQVNYYKKGNDYFEKALVVIQSNFSDMIEVITTTSIPYEEYIVYFDRAHIILDQTFTYDQGYNALEAMAKGKVVFTGAEKEFYNYYNLEQTVAINALPNVEAIIQELIHLIENPEKITEIGNNAIEFVKQHHALTKSAQKYLDTWGV
ncbi:MAG: glycosyltransferase family 1 protein [Flavobacteriales bacterium]|nr:glycosyltransferase family 1 protein [Flavobacteriales bacterium]